MQNVNVLSTATQVLPPRTASLQAKTLVLQNQSDTAIKLAFGENKVNLSATVGISLEPKESTVIDGSIVYGEVTAIHGATGSKVLHWQLI